MGMRSESSSPLHSNFLDAATARFRAGNTLNMGGFCPKRSLRARFKCVVRCAAASSPSGNNRGGGGAHRPISVCLIPVAANPYIDFQGDR